MPSLIERFKDRIRATENEYIISILKHSPKYLGASLFSGVVTVVMTKYYTHVFDPAAYGVLALYITLFQYMQNFIAFSVDASSQRVYFDFKGEDRREFLGTTLIFMSASAAFWVIVAIPAGPYVVRFLGGTLALFWATIVLTVVYMFTNFLIRIAYSEHRSALVARRGVLQTTANQAASVFFIAVTHLGAFGYQLGSVVSYAFTGIQYARNLSNYGDFHPVFKFRTDVTRRLLYFAIPAFFTTAITASLSYLDRIFLKIYHGAAQVGIYSLGYTLGQGMTLVIEAVSMAVFPTLMRELDRDYDRSIDKLKRFDLYFGGTLVAVATVIYLLRFQIVRLLSNESFAAAANVLPLIVLTFVLGGFYKVVSGVLSYHGIVRFYPALTILAFGINALLNFLLIPKYNEVGAAYATFIGALIYSLVIHIRARRYYYRLSRVFAVYSVILLLGTFMFLQGAQLI